MHQTEKKTKFSRPLVAGLFGAAFMLITLGAGCAPQTVSNEPPTGATGTPTPPPSPPPTSEPPTTEPPPLQPTPAPSPAPTPAPTPAPKPGKSTYKDGTYTAQGGYFTHAGPESVSVTLKIKNDVVVDTQFQGSPSAMMSQRYMQVFADNYKPMVIGQNLADVCNLGNVAGASLTPNGFNDACAQIQSQAKA